MISNFFIRRPIVAIVISVPMVIIGAITMLTLPIAQFPDIAPPEIRLQALYPGADAETLAYWMMLCLSFSYRLDYSVFAVKASLNPTALFLVSFLALVVNIAVFVYNFAKVLKYRRNIAVGVHSDLGEYQALVAERVSGTLTVPPSRATT
jgi:hypothetical protein